MKRFALVRSLVSRVGVRSGLSAALAVSFFALSACGDGDVGSFTIERQTSEKKVEGGLMGTIGQAAPFANPFTFNINLERELDKRDAEGAKDVHLEKLKFKVTDQDDNFNFLDKVVFRADADGETEKEVARKDPVPTDVKEFNFDVESGVDLKPYVKKGMKLRTSVEGSQPPEDRTFRAVITILVETL